MSRFGQEPPVVRDPLLGTELEIDPAVDAPTAEMAVDGSFIAVAVHQGAKVAEVIAEPVRRNGAVFPAVPGDGLAGDKAGRSERGLAIHPHFALLDRIGDDPDS